MHQIPVAGAIRAVRRKNTWTLFRNQLELQSMILPGLLVIIVFEYVPIYGVTIAFRDYSLASSIFESPWVGLKHFQAFLRDPMAPIVIQNTLGINLIGLALGFPAPIVFALLLNELRTMRFKRFVQTVSYLPHFMSWVIFGGLIIRLLSPDTGVVNNVLMRLGLIQVPIFFMGRPDYFWFIAVFTSVAKSFGFGAILYLAAIAGIDQQLYEAAIVDGAGRFRRMWHITLPSIIGTTVILMIFAVSGILNTGFEQIWMLQNNLNVSRAETIDTYVYKIGLQHLRFSYSTAVGLMRSVIAVILVVATNALSRRVTERGLF